MQVIARKLVDQCQDWSPDVSVEVYDELFDHVWHSIAIINVSGCPKCHTGQTIDTNSVSLHSSSSDVFILYNAVDDTVPSLNGHFYRTTPM